MTYPLKLLIFLAWLLYTAADLLMHKITSP